MHAEQEALICSGPRRGKQFTYALLDDVAPPAQPLARDEALARFATRFFTSRGPATVHDLARWATLTVTDATRAAEAAAPGLRRESLDGVTHWSAPGADSLRSGRRMKWNPAARKAEA